MQKRRQRLAMKNDFSARERKFIGRLAEDLHLNVRWDEFAVVLWGGAMILGMKKRSERKRKMRK
jgi:hypothetical protein